MARSRYLQQPTSDIRVQDHGSILLVIPVTPASEGWLRDHTDGTWFAGGLVVEPRYAADLLQGAAADGFRIELHA
jgi:hypothetical protein